MPGVQGSGLPVTESSEAEQALETQLSEAPGAALAAVRGTVILPWLWTVSSAPCLGPASKGAGLPQLGSLLTWNRVTWAAAVARFIALWKLCHLSLGIIISATWKDG